MLPLHHIGRSAALDAQEAFIRIGFAIAATDWFVILRTHFVTSLELERRQASFDWHNEHVSAAILFAHVAFAAIEFVVRAAYKIGWFVITIGIALRGGGTIGQRDGYDACTTCLLFHFAQRTVHIAIGRTNWAGCLVFHALVWLAHERSGFQLGACADVG